MKILGLELARLEQKDINIVLAFCAVCFVVGALSFSLLFRYVSPFNAMIFVPDSKSSADELSAQTVSFPIGSIVISSTKQQTTTRDPDLSLKQYEVNNPTHTVFDLQSIIFEVIATLLFAFMIFGLLWTSMVKKFLSHLS